MELEGLVERRHVARGSKAEHDAVVLRTPRRIYWLRRRGGHPYQDARLDTLVGHRLRGSGSIAGPWFIIDRWEIVADEPATSRPQPKMSQRGRSKTAAGGKTKRVLSK